MWQDFTYLSYKRKKTFLVTVFKWFTAKKCKPLYIIRFQRFDNRINGILCKWFPIIKIPCDFIETSGTVMAASAYKKTIACMLTIVGYSINATIVIFDRIREEMKNSSRNTDLKDLVNRCITQTLTRCIYTSLTTFVMVAVLYVMGVSSIKEFALPLMAGIVCGAYSSVCITGALWYVMKTGKNAKVQAASVPAKQVESVKTESSEESSSDGNVQKAVKSKTKKKKKRR